MRRYGVGEPPGSGAAAVKIGYGLGAAAALIGGIVTVAGLIMAAFFTAMLKALLFSLLALLTGAG